jgi:exonuclease III
MNQDELSILNIFAPNTRAHIFVREMFLKLKSHIEPHTIVVGDFNTLPHQSRDHGKKKLNRDPVTLREVMNQMDLIDIYRTFYPKKRIYLLSTS